MVRTPQRKTCKLRLHLAIYDQVSNLTRPSQQALTLLVLRGMNLTWMTHSVSHSLDGIPFPADQHVLTPGS
jgi:hypothetical protein